MDSFENDGFKIETIEKEEYDSWQTAFSFYRSAVPAESWQVLDGEPILAQTDNVNLFSFTYSSFSTKIATPKPSTVYYLLFTSPIRELAKQGKWKFRVKSVKLKCDLLQFLRKN